MTAKEEMVRTVRRSTALLLAVAVAGLALAGCTRTAVVEEEGGSTLASVEPVEGSDVARVTLTADAAERLGIETVVVGEAPGGDRGAAQRVVPYAAVLYDPDGNAWTYTNPSELVFLRVPISVERVRGRDAVLSDGPRPGTRVVTVGAAELLGTEYGVGEE